MNINEPINKAKKLNIIAVADDSDFGNYAVLHGIQLSKVFNASLKIFTNFGFQYSSTSSSSKHILSESNSELLKGVDCEIVEKYYFPEILFNFADETNTAMIVIGVDKNKKSLFPPKKAIKFIKSSRFPVMTVTEEPFSDDDYKKVLLPLDIERQNKEKALWAGYFSRFHNSTVIIDIPEYKDEGLKKLVKDNLDFVEKLYENLEVKHEVVTDNSSSYFDEYSLQKATELNAGVSVIMMTRYYTLADIITGPRERKIIGKSKTPLLCINQRDDLYVLCT